MLALMGSQGKWHWRPRSVSLLVSVLIVGLSYGARNVLSYTRRMMQNYLAKLPSIQRQSHHPINTLALYLSAKETQKSYGRFGGEHNQQRSVGNEDRSWLVLLSPKTS